MATRSGFRTFDSEAGKPGREEGTMHHPSIPAPTGRTNHVRSKIVAVVVSLLTLGGLTLGYAVSASAAGPRRDDVALARQATRKFHSVRAVGKAGYKKFTDVNGVTCIDGPVGRGNMGVHYVNADLVDGVIDVSQPEAVLYEHTTDGPKLTAVEYITPVAAWQGAQPPELFGRQFMRINAPNRFGLPDFYALHAWIWKTNPRGTFLPWNPDVHCTNNQP